MRHVSLMLATLLTTQMSELPRGQFPEGWQVRIDGPSAQAARGAASPAAAVAAGPAARDIAFVVMKPGWHITTGPSAILYQPALKASGIYSVKAETFLFDPEARNEAYGVLIGGRNLDRDDQAYTSFVIRRSGEFLITRRSGATTATVKDWTPHTAIRTWDQRGAGERSVRNILEVRVAADSVAFVVNAEEVARVPTRDIDTEGIVGLRIDRHLNLHVSVLDIGT